MRRDGRETELIYFIFLHVFTVENVGPEPLFYGRVSEELSQIEGTRTDVLGLLGKLGTSKSAGSGGLGLRVVKKLKYEIVDLPTSICNLSLKSSSMPKD